VGKAAGRLSATFSVSLLEEMLSLLRLNVFRSDCDS
jgi:hypothetical protein